MSGTVKSTGTKRRVLAALAAGLSLMAATEHAEAQEIQLTGPLAGAPAVRKLRLYREGRIEIAPAVSFTLLDEYQRTIFVGARVNYNLTDWLAVGGWGAFGALKLSTDLTTRTQEINEERRQDPNYPTSTTGRLTAENMSADFEEQLGTMDYVLAPQITAVPFRGKLALFQDVYIDADLYFFAGPAFVGVSERGDCEIDCGRPETFETESGIRIAPTFGLGFTFYVNKWNAIGFEWRALPFSRNTGGFDTRGGDPDGEFPDRKITGDDRQFKFNQMLTISYSFFFPQEYRISE